MMGRHSRPWLSGLLFDERGDSVTRAFRLTRAGTGGTVAGYFVLTVAANLETWQFYRLRSWVTGRVVMSEIVAHPADRWVVPVLLALFVGGGAAAAVLLTGWLVPSTRRQAEPAATAERGRRSKS